MTFEETGNMLTFSNIKKCFIYFLLQGNEVVYVGQTRAGLSRPYSHTDKEFDTIKLIPCSLDELDFLEDKFISKYLPKYNKARNHNVVYSLHRAKEIIQLDYDYPKFNLRKLREALSALKIIPFNDGFKGYECITVDQFCKVHHYIGERLQK